MNSMERGSDSINAIQSDGRWHDAIVVVVEHEARAKVWYRLRRGPWVGGRDEYQDLYSFTVDPLHKLRNWITLKSMSQYKCAAEQKRSPKKDHRPTCLALMNVT